MLEDLKAFVAVVDRNSLTRAADALALTQSAVSRRVQQLEETLGTTLLDRTNRPPTATAVGRRVHQSGVELLRDLERLLDIPREDGEPSGAFMLGLPQLVADAALVEIAIRTKKHFPALELKYRTEWSTGLQAALAGGELDAAVVMLPKGASPPASVSASHVTTFEVLVVQSKRHPLVPRATSMAEIAGREWILNPLGCGYRAALERAANGIGQQVRLGIDVHGTETQLRLVAAGLGLGLIPRHLLARSEQRRELSVVSVEDLAIRIDVWLMHAPQLGNLRRAVDILGQVLSETLKAR